MIETTGSVFDYYGLDGCTIIVPTSGSVSGGNAVMGAGVALDAKNRVPGLARELGIMLIAYGNDVHTLDEGRLQSFPTKHTWQQPADIELIAKSVLTLKWEAMGAPDRMFIVPAWPGCGEKTGKLPVDKVRPLFETLPDNVLVVTKEK